MINNINAYVIQENLRNNHYISIPMIQKEYNLGYREAKEFLHELIFRNWVTQSEICGIEHRVKKSNLKLRHIRRAEVDRLIDEVEPEWTTVLVCIAKRDGGGATYDEILQNARDKDGISMTLELLLELELIYEADDKYYNCVSEMVIRALLKVVTEKHMLNIKERLGFTDEERMALKKMLEKLCCD